MELDAKKRFNESPHAKPWSDYSATTAFGEAANAAIAVMQSTQIAKDSNEAAANYWRMEGARSVIAILAHLTDAIPERPKPIRPQNLNHSH